MIYRSTHLARRELFELATTQGGYFTAKQAQQVGYGNRHVDYHAKAGNFERVERGIFRLPFIPLSENDDLIRLCLWSRNRGDQPQAVVSHDTALGLHGLGSLLPTRIHLTVPPSFRKPVPAGCVLHRHQLPAEDVEYREGFQVTTPLRTILDVAGENSVAQEQLNGIVKQAVIDGIVRRSMLQQLASDKTIDTRLVEAIVSAED